MAQQPHLPLDDSPIDDRLDRLITTAIARCGLAASRRSVLTRLGQLTLALGGASVATLLPSDRRVALAVSCSDWQYCGISGKPCAGCGGSDHSCPSAGCCTAGAGWSACCTDPGACGKIIVYKDCCNTGCGSCPSVSCSHNCNPGSQQFWCNGGNSSNYRCTLAQWNGQTCPC